ENTLLIKKYNNHIWGYENYLLLLFRKNQFIKKVNNKKNNEPIKINNNKSQQESNYVWATQDIDSKEFYKKIIDNEIKA
ncbi:MAG: hypothetical protein R3321_07175, partial [Nitrososphaeraceae archaeon]|nr:hypothetical protein [Nitrososphaeraceae archaeon]